MDMREIIKAYELLIAHGFDMSANKKGIVDSSLEEEGFQKEAAQHKTVSVNVSAAKKDVSAETLNRDLEGTTKKQFDFLSHLFLHGDRVEESHDQEVVNRLPENLEGKEGLPWRQKEPCDLLIFNGMKGAAGNSRQT